MIKDRKLAKLSFLIIMYDFNCTLFYCIVVYALCDIDLAEVESILGVASAVPIETKSSLDPTFF